MGIMEAINRVVKGAVAAHPLMMDLLALVEKEGKDIATHAGMAQELGDAIAALDQLVKDARAFI